MVAKEAEGVNVLRRFGMDLRHIRDYAGSMVSSVSISVQSSMLLKAWRRESKLGSSLPCFCALRHCRSHAAKECYVPKIGGHFDGSFVVSEGIVWSKRPEMEMEVCGGGVCEDVDVDVVVWRACTWHLPSTTP